MSAKELTKQEQYDNEARKFIARVYGWMAFALIISGISALATAIIPAVTQFIFGSKAVFMGLLIVELALVIVLSALIQKMPLPLAVFTFFLYSIVNGMTISAIFLIYEVNSICIIFFISAAMFAAMTVYGFITKQDLTSAGRYLVMALFGVIIAAIVNLFLKSGLLEWITSLVCLVIFIGLTAYDTQKISRAAENAVDNEAYKKASIYGALELYLDFINIFLKLLSLFGKKRN